MFKKFSFLIIAAIFFLSVVAKAQNSNPLDLKIASPVFLNFSGIGNSSVAGKDEINISFSSDYDKCREKYGNNYYQACQPRLELDGKKIETGSTIMTANGAVVPGQWRWTSDYSLSFIPSQYWLAGENYIINLDLDKMGVPDNVIVNGARIVPASFRTSPLEVSYKDLNYMQDPEDPQHKLISGLMTSNYPVDAQKLKSAITLTDETGTGTELVSKEYKQEFEFTPVADGMSARLAVPIKTLPTEDHFLHVSVKAGLEPLHGGAPTAGPFSERTRIPTLSSYLNFKATNAVIAREEDGTPQQLLTIETNVKAKPDDVLKHVKLYLLPAQHPVMQRAEVRTDKIYVWKADNEVTPDILKLSEALPLKLTTKEKNEITQFNFSFTAPVGRYLYIVVDKDLPAFGGYTLGRPYQAILQAPLWPNDVKILQDGSILTLSGARKLSLHARGTDKLSIEVAHIRIQALQHFISQTSGDIRTPSFKNWNFSKEDIAKIDTKDVPMNYVSPQAAQYAAFDFSEYLKGDTKGLFLLDIQGYRDNKIAGEKLQRFVLITNLGLIIKKNADNTRDAFLISFTTGKPTVSADVSVLGRNGLSVFDGKTDADGHLALPNFDTLKNEKEPVGIIAKKDGDFTFIPYNRSDRTLNLSKFEVGGNSIAAKGMNAFMFTDRGIYRPGDTAHIGALVRNADWEALPPGLPLQLVVTDPRGRVVQDSILKFPTQGLQEKELATEEAWPTGVYRANLYISQDGQQGSQLGGTSFRVEDFQPDRMKIKTVFTPAPVKGWSKASGLQAKVNLTNLYGTPATDRRLTAAVTLNPAELSFESYKNYHFYDSYAAAPRAITYDLPETKTDIKGEATIGLELEQQPASTFSLNLQTRGYEAGNGRGVTSYSTLMISPMDYAVGYRTDGNLAYLKKGHAYNVDLISIDPDLKPLTVKDLTMDLVRKNFVSTLVKRNDGSYAYESVPKEVVVETRPFKIDDMGTTLALPTNSIGSFVYRIKTKDGLTVADIPFSVAGEGQQTGMDREAVLNVSINKESYEPGESIELNITAPYTGAGLITLESDHVVEHKWFRTDKTDTLQKIAIPAEFSGKGYVNVEFVRDINSREIYLSPLSYAVVPFTANTEKRTVKIDLQAPEKVLPGQPVTVTYSGNAKGKAVIYAVDEGILQIARYKTPDPVDFFMLDRALQVNTSQMLDLLMPEYDLVRELSSKGGDAEAEAAVLGKHLNPFKRKTLAPAVFWSGIVDLDTKEKNVTFTPPAHFNSEMRVMAVAVTDQGVGNAEQKITVQSELVITPNLPAFMAPGDEADISATIANNATSASGSTIDLSAKPTDGVTIVSPISKNIVIPAGTEKTVIFKIRATEQLGPASVTISAALGNIRRSAEATLSIRPASAKETTLLTGYAEKGEAEIKPQRDVYNALAGKDLTVSALPSSYIFGLMRYLDGFPYGCSEQLVSKVFPQLSLYQNPEFAVSQEQMKEKIESVVTDLRQRQTSEGGFSLWGGDRADDFVTVYAMDFLTRAQDLKLPVPSSMTEDGLQYLRGWVNHDVTSSADARVKAYGTYILTRNGMVTTNEILHILKYFDDKQSTEWKHDLTAIYIASSYSLMKQSAMAEETLTEFEKSIDMNDISYNRSETPWYDSFTEYSQYVSLIAEYFPEHLEAMDPKIVFRLANYIKQQNYNTLSAAYAIQALHDYSEKSALAKGKHNLEVDGKAVPLKGDKVLKASIPVTAKSLEISGDKTPLFYSLAETGFDKATPKEKLAQNIEIERSYQNLNGTPVTEQVAVGDIVEAVIKIRSYDSRTIENVAIVDLLPGGFELEDDAGKDSTLMTSFIDKREDRIIAFATITPDEKTFHYRMRAVAKGKFVVAPIFAEAMYDLTTKARGLPGAITVADPQ